MYGQRDIVLIPIPYTDLSSHKRRPVVIISNDKYNRIFEDIIVVALTSNLELVEFSILLNNNGLEEGHLKMPSLIRPNKIYTLHKDIIIKKFGNISKEVLKQVKKSINKVIE